MSSTRSGRSRRPGLSKHDKVDCGYGSASLSEKGRGNPLEYPAPGLPAFSEVRACQDAGIYKRGVPAAVKEWKLWRIRRERMKEIYRHDERNEYEYSSAAETDDETKPLDYLRGPINRIARSGNQLSERDKSQSACRRKSTPTSRKASRRDQSDGQSGACLSQSAEQAVKMYTKEVGLSPQEQELARRYMKEYEEQCSKWGLGSNPLTSIGGAGHGKSTSSKVEKPYGYDQVDRQQRSALKPVVDMMCASGKFDGVTTCGGLIIPMPYTESGQSRQRPAISAKIKACRPALTIDLGVIPDSCGSSSSSLPESSSTAPSSAASTSSANNKVAGPSFSEVHHAPINKSSDAVRKSSLSEVERYYADLVATIRKLALNEGTSLETILHNVIVAIYSKVFARGPCPPQISGISGPPIDCNDTPDKHIKAAQAFTHKIWSMSNPYAITAGQWGLKESEVFVLRMIIFVRCVAGWYKLDVEEGIVDEDFEGKGKGKSLWW